MSNLIEQIVRWALGIVSHFGYVGIFITMTLESAAIPIPSEVVLPFGGFLAANGEFSFWSVVFVATAANLIGSVILYYVGFWGGRPVLNKYGKFVFIHEREVVKLENWLRKYGTRVAFFSRLLPGVRTFAPFVIGMGEMKIFKFGAYTLAGSFIWNGVLTYVGFKAGANWDVLRPYFHKYDLVLAGLVVVGIVFLIYKHLNKEHA